MGLTCGEKQREFQKQMGNKQCFDRETSVTLGIFLHQQLHTLYKNADEKSSCPTSAALEHTHM